MTLFWDSASIYLRRSGRRHKLWNSRLRSSQDEMSFVLLGLENVNLLIWGDDNINVRHLFKSFMKGTFSVGCKSIFLK